MTALLAGVVLPADGVPASQGAQGALMHEMHCQCVYSCHALHFGHVPLGFCGPMGRCGTNLIRGPLL